MKPSGAMQVELWEHRLQTRAEQVACSKGRLRSYAVSFPLRGLLELSRSRETC